MGGGGGYEMKSPWTMPMLLSKKVDETWKSMVCLISMNTNRQEFLTALHWQGNLSMRLALANLRHWRRYHCDMSIPAHISVVISESSQIWQPVIRVSCTCHPVCFCTFLFDGHVTKFSTYKKYCPRPPVRQQKILLTIKKVYSWSLFFILPENLTDCQHVNYSVFSVLCIPSVDTHKLKTSDMCAWIHISRGYPCQCDT